MVNTPPPVDPTVNTDRPKVKELSATGDRRTWSFTTKGMLDQALSDACRERSERPGQLMIDLLEKFLVSENYLPDWWFERKF